MPRHARLSPSAAALDRTRTLLIAVLLALLFAACAPDTSKNSAAGDAFASKVLRECGSKHLGVLSISDLMNIVSPRYSAFFVQITSRYGQGTMSWDEYVRGVMTVNGGGDAESVGLSCIRAIKP